MLLLYKLLFIPDSWLLEHHCLICYEDDGQSQQWRLNVFESRKNGYMQVQEGI